MDSSAPTVRPAVCVRLSAAGRVGVVLLLALQVAMALWAVSGKSVTADEILHLTGGYFYNKFGDYRTQPENGNLPQRVAGLPAALGNAPPPPMEGNLYWRTSDSPVVGYQFFYETGHDHWPMLMSARALMTIFCVGAGLLVFCWSRRLFGTPAGFLSLALFTFCPNLLAHAPLATSDMAAVFFLPAALGAFWRHLAQPTWKNGFLSAVVFGFACVAKYSAALLPVMMLLLVAWRVALTPAGERARWWRLALLSFTAHGATGILVIWAFFGFRYSGAAPGIPAPDHYIALWESVLSNIGFHARLVNFCREWRLLPEAYLYGYAFVLHSAQFRSAFLAGDYSLVGWVEFFPLAFLWKTPLAVLAACTGGLVIAARRWREVPFARIAPLLVLFVVYWIFSLTSHLNIGHRHILPIYPVLYIFLGGLAAPGVLRGAWRIALPLALVAGQVTASVRVAPHYLAFFNSLAGGPANGYRLLVDSSLDWGQDLPALAAWLRENHRETDPTPVHLSYFGSGNPSYYQIRAVRLPAVNGFRLPRLYYEPRAGLYCISATMLQHVYSTIRGPWAARHEKAYQEGRAKEALFREYWRNPAIREELARIGEAKNFERTWQNYDDLRFARLCHYLRARQPDAQPGYSILVYRLTQAELDEALGGDLRQFAAAIERMLANRRP